MMTLDTFTVHAGDPTSPVLVHVPHAATTIPDWPRTQIVLDDTALAVELGHMTDADTDTLALHAAEQATIRPWLFINRLSRLVIDPERFPDDTEEMLQVGMGAVYTRTAHGQPLRTDNPDRNNKLLEQYFHPYAQALAELVDERLAATGHAIILDLHSYPKHRLPYELHPNRHRPPVCLGTDSFHTPDWLAHTAHTAFTPIGQVLNNEPFAGTYVPLPHYERDSRVASIMIELRRDTYHQAVGGTPDAIAGVTTALATIINQATAR